MGEQRAPLSRSDIYHQVALSICAATIAILTAHRGYTYTPLAFAFCSGALACLAAFTGVCRALNQAMNEYMEITRKMLDDAGYK